MHLPRGLQRAFIYLVQSIHYHNFLFAPFTKIVQISVFTTLSKSSIFSSPQINVVQSQVETAQESTAPSSSRGWGGDWPRFPSILVYSCQLGTGTRRSSPFQKAAQVLPPPPL